MLDPLNAFFQPQNLSQARCQLSFSLNKKSQVWTRLSQRVCFLPIQPNEKPLTGHKKLTRLATQIIRWLPDLVSLEIRVRYRYGNGTDVSISCETIYRRLFTQGKKTKAGQFVTHVVTSNALDSFTVAPKVFKELIRLWIAYESQPRPH
jgi:hypothetical protein